MPIVRQLLQRKIRFGGEKHSGWLPPGAATPLPIPIEEAVVDFEIISDDRGDGCVLQWVSRNTLHHGDIWRESLEGEIGQARNDFGIDPHEWKIIG
jgi:hypothetical protein